MKNWIRPLRTDPLEPLLGSPDPAIRYFAERDLLDEPVPPIDTIWDLPEAQRILRKQQADGSWKSGSHKGTASGVKYTLIETWRQFRVLVEQYEFHRGHPAIALGAEFLFSCQTEEGDIRGILANQYAPYYTGAILYLLIRAGTPEDPRVERGLRWLLDVRQDDGGWVIGSPGLMGLPHLSWKDVCVLTSDGNRPTMRAFDRSKPFSAAGTGMVIRAFAVHPAYRKAAETVAAARLLKSKFLRKDNWSSFQHPDHWIRFQYPFWWTNLVSALDSLSRMGWSPEDDDVRRALGWLVDHQEPDGLWKVSYSHIHKETNSPQTRKMQHWISLAICRIFRRFWSA
ncbi:MAG: hypothetical protein NTU59_02050 [Coprothermobacterota bacterium]|nr:hypothetical protein [Coprothermobacterota bacterium]